MTLGDASGRPIPRLTSHTTRFESGGTPLDWVDPDGPLLFQRQGLGLVGLGQAVIARFSGAHRFREASEWWKAITEASTSLFDDTPPGEGLVAFGTFSFDEESLAESRLIIPEVVIRFEADGAWITRIELEGGAPNTRQPRLFDQHNAPAAVTWEKGEMGEAKFLQAVRHALTTIGQGVLKKVVIARDMRAAVPTGFTPVPALQALASNYKDTHLFAIDGLFGASPETLCLVEGNTLTTTVLAGTTRPLGVDTTEGDLAEGLRSSAKDQEEHRLAVESVVDALQSKNITATADATPHVVALKNLMHLATTIRGEIPEGLTGLDIVDAVHPTAAVAGTPRDGAVAFIRRVEPFDRGGYAGPVGWMDASGNSEWAIALRCAHYDKEASLLTAYAGAGIVAGSDPETELAETKLKFRPIVDALGGS